MRSTINFLHKTAVAGVSVGLMLAGCGLFDRAPGRIADGPARPATLLVGPVFATLDPALPQAVALAVDHGGRVVQAFATFADIDATFADLPRLTVPGALAVPGLRDAHVHLGWIGELDAQVDLSSCRSVGEIVEAVRRHAERWPDAAVVRGRGWDEQRLEAGPALDAAALAGVDARGRPIALTRVDGHAVWLDRVALERAQAAGWLDGADPAVRVVRGPDGAPTGLVIDPPHGLWDLFREPTDAAGLEARHARALHVLADAGYFEVHAMAFKADELSALRAARAKVGARAPRVVVWLEDEAPGWQWLETHAPGPVWLGDGLRVEGIKLFADGALGSRGAWLHAPYGDASDHFGAGVAAGPLGEAAARALRLGFGVAVHAIGDRAVSETLTAFEDVRHAGILPAPGGAAPTLRIEHAQVAQPVDLQRFRAAGVVASVQPLHALADAAWAGIRLGPERTAHAYRLASLRDAGINVVVGSDAPIEAHDPVGTLRAAVWRQGPVETGRGDEAAVAVNPGERVDVETALALMRADVAPVPVGRRLAWTLFDRDFVSDPTALKHPVKVIGRVFADRDGQVVIDTPQHPR
jgi:predicted amidohydrolase YtcJ